MNPPGPSSTVASHIGLLLENVKFAHTVFAMPFALMGLFLAAASAAASDGGPMTRVPPLGVFVLVVVCMVAARCAAMTANRIADRRIDAGNSRTSGRPMVTGRLGTRAAWAFLVGSSATFIVSAGGFWWLYANPWPVVLSLPVLAVLCGYSWAKRFTQLSHFWLGLALGLSPAGAWIAASPRTLGLAAAVLSAAVLLWTAGFDLLYACQDVESDRRQGLFAMPARLGVPAALWISRACHTTMVGLLVVLGVASRELGWLYFAGVGVTAALLAIEQWLVRPDDLSRINTAFFTINGAVSVLLGALAIVDVVFVK